jgi:hypothetical protein
MSVILAGNTSVSMRTSTCPPEGCAFVPPVDLTVARFLWSDRAAWAALNTSFPCGHAPGRKHPSAFCSDSNPCGCSDVVIAPNWVVTLDVSTPMLNSLTIRGTLIVKHDATDPLALHANLINVKGGHFIIGNATNPFHGARLPMCVWGGGGGWGYSAGGNGPDSGQPPTLSADISGLRLWPETSLGNNFVPRLAGPKMQVFLHGDYYFHGGVCTKPVDLAMSEYGCFKQMVVNGELSVRGRSVPVVTRSLGADAVAGATALRLDGDADGWEAGDDILVSSSASGGVPEYHTIKTVLGNLVTLKKALTKDKIGTTVTVTDAANGLPETTLDGRSTVSLLTRNVEVCLPFFMPFHLQQTTSAVSLSIVFFLSGKSARRKATTSFRPPPLLVVLIASSARELIVAFHRSAEGGTSSTTSSAASARR